MWDALIKAGCEVNRVAKNGRTPLTEAIGRASVQGVKYLVSRGAKVDGAAIEAAGDRNNRLAALGQTKGKAR